MSRPGLLTGRLVVEITGYGKERFFHIAAQRGLFVSEIAEDSRESRVFFTTTPGAFRSMKPAARKAGVRLRIRKKQGLPFFLYRNRNRKLFAGGLLFFFLFLKLLSLYIWDISFGGNQWFTDEMLFHYLETIPVVCGMKKTEVSCERLEEAIRNQFPEITWVSAEIRGTRLFIQVRENEAVLAVEKEEEGPCDLAAKKDGEIVGTVIRSGILEVRAGDKVAAGDLLVSGTIPITDDGEAVVNTHPVHADAEIYARTQEVFLKKLPGTRMKKAYTGRTRYGVSIEAFGHSFCFLPPVFGKEDSWEFLTEQVQAKLFEDFYLPLSSSFLKGREYVLYEEAVSCEEAQKAAEGYLNEYMENLLEKGIQILGNNVKIERNESGWQIRGLLTVVEDIAKEVPIPETQEEIQTEYEHH